MVIEIFTAGKRLRVRLLPGESWKEAAERAIQRAHGKAAGAWDWRVESEEQLDGKTVRVHWRATVVGRRDKRTNNYPVLGTATAETTPEED